MIISICAIGLIGVGLLALALQRFYTAVPLKELKRMAARGDALASALYRPSAYGTSMRLFLWGVFGFSTAAGLLLLHNLPGTVAYTIAVLTLVGALAAQSMRLTVHNARLAVQSAPVISWLMRYLHAPIDRIASLLGRSHTRPQHSGLYEKEDLVALLQQQTEQPDNRIAKSDLELVARAAQFDDIQAADIVTPMSRIRLVDLHDHIGPVLLDELHASGQNSFLIYDQNPEHVVGTLFLRDAVSAKEGGEVSELMHPRLSFVHEDFTLRQVLHAFMKTGQFMVVVINAFEEAVGAITLQHLLEQLVGHRDPDDFDSFEDRSAVAAFRQQLVAEPIPVDTIPDEEENPSPETTEVVESE